MAVHELDDQELLVLRALRAAPDRGLGELADAVGLPRTSFGRPLSRPLRKPVSQLVVEGLVEDHVAATGSRSAAAACSPSMPSTPSSDR